MKRISYLLLVSTLFLIISFPPRFSSSMRQKVVSCLVPFWDWAIWGNALEVEGESLRLENRLLHDQISSVYEWLTFEERVQQQVDLLKSFSNKEEDTLYWQEFFRKRSEDLKQILEAKLQALPAKVIFRDPLYWGGSLWINIGEKDNEFLGKTVVAKNSPVVVGSALVGIVEEVSKNQSKVRLITDAALTPAVRAVRGNAQDYFLFRLGKDLLDLLYKRENILKKEEREELLKLLSKLVKNSASNGKSWYLAKGEIHGASAPLWRGGAKLEGIGFNYNNDDEEGPGRDLFTGKLNEKKEGCETMPIIQEGDLLITSGLDGLFPAGLEVGWVSKVKALKESGYCYDIEAKSASPLFEELSVVFVMPPLGFEKK